MPFPLHFRGAVLIRDLIGRASGVCELVLFCVLGIAGSAAVGLAGEPLPAQVDRLMAEIHPGPETVLCSDGEFLRRVYLDLVGRIPTGDESRRFLDDRSEDKRERLVDQLLESPDHARFMAQAFDVMLMERRAAKYVPDKAWRDYLISSFEKNKPFHELAREILAADGVDEDHRAAAAFYLEREVEPHLLTREVGRMFFGMDLQCAQCHDHPNIDDYYQSDYYGLFAFLGRSFLFRPDPKKPAVLAEKAEGDASYESVFTGETGTTLPRLPGGLEVPQPVIDEDNAYRVKPDPKDKKVRPVPTHSRREQLAAVATDGSNRAFNRNIANRLWAHMMGRGLVHPVDQHHSENPPAHPQLLELLADEFAAHRYDVRWMLGGLAKSRTYQRSFNLPEALDDHLVAAVEETNRWRKRAAELSEMVDEQKQRVHVVESSLSELNASIPGLIEIEAETRERVEAAQQNFNRADQAFNTHVASIDNHQTAAKLVRDAVKDIEQASELLATDSDLAETTQIVRAQQTRAEKALETLRTGQAALAAERQMAEQSLADAKSAAEDATARTAQAREERRSIADQLVAANEELRLLETSVSHVRQQLGRLERLTEYGQQRARQQTLRSKLGDVATQRQASADREGQLSAQLKQVVAEWEDAKRCSDQAATSLQAVAAATDVVRDVAALLKDPVSSSNRSAELSTANPEFAARVDQLNSRSSELTRHAEVFRESLADLQQQRGQLANVVDSLDRRRIELAAELAAATARHQTLEAEYLDLRREIDEQAATLSTHRASLVSAWSQQFSLSVIQPLSPEQLARSILRVTGYEKSLRAGVQAAVQKKFPLDGKESHDAKTQAAIEQEIANESEKKIQSVVDRFEKLFAAAGGQPQDDFFATVDQALFFSNGGEIRSWLAPNGDNLTGRLQAIEAPGELADQLYLNLLSRYPTAEEKNDVAEYLATPEVDRKQAVQEMAWALLTSAEFRFQY